MRVEKYRGQKLRRSKSTRVISGMTDRIYHAQPAYSSTHIKAMDDAPARARYLLQHGSPDKPEYQFGRAGHARLLQHKIYRDQFRVAPSIGRRSKADRAEWSAWYSAHGGDGPAIVDRPAAEWNLAFTEQTGRELISADDHAAIEALAAAVFANPNAARLLEGGRPEHSIFWTDPPTGLRLRCRPDLWRDDCVIDIKTAADASPRAFQTALARYRYHLQAAHYSAGIAAATGADAVPPFCFLVIEKAPPYLSAVYELDAESAIEAEYQWRELVERLAECLDTDTWPGYEGGQLTLPAWARPAPELDLEGVI